MAEVEFAPVVLSKKDHCGRPFAADWTHVGDSDKALVATRHKVTGAKMAFGYLHFLRQHAVAAVEHEDETVKRDGACGSAG